MKFEIGRVYIGNEYKHYITLGPSIGVDASIGVIGGVHQNKNSLKAINFADLNGWSGSHNIGVLSGDISFGRNNKGNKPFLPYWMADAANLTNNNSKDSYISGGFGGSIGSPVGYTYNFEYTRVFTFSGIYNSIF
ncbi:hypothetical protein [Reichenbachiella sp. MSK19-1]|uniref:hypothetical protein n=1 Tax=Reichenbachiella sp. MSK19-1 TaxID=1897631 RepID=UPI000E6C5D77|nr:hypothetical protein [Reichenbachiella sp. MSK19-1]RJE74980.1 hypothetical protein BGP76_17835 [Reichenbachiella sp. MSK19-1]